LNDKYVPRTALFDLEPGLIDAVRASPLNEHFRPGNLVNENASAGSTSACIYFAIYRIQFDLTWQVT
jgi:tubulin beta